MTTSFTPMGLFFVPVLYSAFLDNSCNGTVAIYGALIGYIGYIYIAHRPIASACLLCIATYNFLKLLFSFPSTAFAWEV